MKKIALLIIDMVKDNLKEHNNSLISEQTRSIVPRINFLLDELRKCGSLIVFASDSFLKEDFIFKGKMKPHSIRGTRGAEVIDEITKGPNDIFLPKRRFSAFYKTDLDQTLRTKGIDTVAIAGISTTFCVLNTAFDALSNDFRTFIVEDCCAAHKKEAHQQIIDLFRNTPLYPLFRIIDTKGLIKFLENDTDF